MTGDGNGEKFDRQMRASAAYAALDRKLDEQNRLLFGDRERDLPGWLPSIKESIDRLHRNPLVRLGLFIDTAPKALAATVTFFAGASVITLAVHTVGVWAKWWQ